MAHDPPAEKYIELLLRKESNYTLELLTKTIKLFPGFDVTVYSALGLFQIPVCWPRVLV